MCGDQLDFLGSGAILGFNVIIGYDVILDYDVIVGYTLPCSIRKPELTGAHTLHMFNLIFIAQCPEHLPRWLVP